MSHADKQAKEQKPSLSESSELEPIGNAFQSHNSSSIIVQRKNQELLDNSLKVKEGKKIPDFINNSPYMIAQRKQLQKNFGDTLQKKKDPQVEVPSKSKQENKSGLPDQLKTGVENLSGFSMDDVNVHYNSDKPAELQALAYAQGNDIHIGSGQEKHLPHEAWHVVQQKQGRVKSSMQAKGVSVNDDSALETEADIMGALALNEKNASDFSTDKNNTGNHHPVSGNKVVQTRRVPAMNQGQSDGLQEILSDLVPNISDLFIPIKEVDGNNASAHQDGLFLLLQRAFEELTAEQRQQVKNKAMGGLNVAAFKSLDRREQLLRFAHALTITFPGFELKDPKLIGVAPEKDSQLAKNISQLVASVNGILDDVASGKHDKDIKDVFGKAHVSRAKKKYAKAKKHLNKLHRENKIITDASGYAEEIHMEGYANKEEIFLPVHSINSPADPMSVVALFHESIHAGNSDVHDEGYIGSPGFKTLSTAIKMTNSAHFEVIARRSLLGPDKDYDGVFTPSGGTEPELGPLEQGLRDASEIFRMAWTVGLNLQSILMRVHDKPSLWDNEKYSGSLPFWSKVMNLTIHKKTIINSKNIDSHPVSLIDLALSEGFIRKLSKAFDSVPEFKDLNELIKDIDKDTLAKLQTDSKFAKDWIIDHVLEDFYNLTAGGHAMDIQAVMVMGTTPLDYRNILRKRDVTEFS